MGICNCRSISFLSIQSCDSDDTEDSFATVAESNCKIIKP